jgi:hypothetical protein
MTGGPTCRSGNTTLRDEPMDSARMKSDPSSIAAPAAAALAASQNYDETEQRETPPSASHELEHSSTSRYPVRRRCHAGIGRHKRQWLCRGLQERQHIQVLRPHAANQAGLQARTAALGGSWTGLDDHLLQIRRGPAASSAVACRFTHSVLPDRPGPCAKSAPLNWLGFSG